MQPHGIGPGSGAAFEARARRDGSPRVCWVCLAGSVRGRGLGAVPGGCGSGVCSPSAASRLGKQVRKGRLAAGEREVRSGTQPRSVRGRAVRRSGPASLASGRVNGTRARWSSHKALSGAGKPFPGLPRRALLVGCQAEPHVARGPPAEPKAPIAGCVRARALGRELRPWLGARRKSLAPWCPAGSDVRFSPCFGQPPG